MFAMLMCLDFARAARDLGRRKSDTVRSGLYHWRKSESNTARRRDRKRERINQGDEIEE
jgi:hypothetical protein